MFRFLSGLFFWLLRAWPLLSLAPIALAHATAHRFFPCDPILVNKIAGTVLQVVGGLFVLYSVNSNLGLFRNQHLGNVILGWFRSFPLFRRSVTLNASGEPATNFGNPRILDRRVTSTIEDKLAELERQLDEFRQHMNEDIRAVNDRIAETHSELATAVVANSASLNRLTSKLEVATIGGFKHQAFGVLLALYGAVTSLFA